MKKWISKVVTIHYLLYYCIQDFLIQGQTEALHQKISGVTTTIVIIFVKYHCHHKL